MPGKPGVRYTDLVSILGKAWVAAAGAYRSSEGRWKRRAYKLHGFHEPLPVQAGRAGGVLILLHPALTTDAPDLYGVIGEAVLRLDEGVPIVLEFDGRLDFFVADGWRSVAINRPSAYYDPGLMWWPVTR